MKLPWKSARPTRPIPSPRMIVRTLVGVDSIRREIPSCRVVMSSTAPVSAVRNMNRMTWLWAPRLKPLTPAVADVATDSTTTATPGADARLALAAASATSNDTPSCAAANRAARTSADWAATARSTVERTAPEAVVGGASNSTDAVPPDRSAAS